MSFFSNAVKSGYFMYMVEAEGRDDLVNTRQARINAAALDMLKNPNITTTPSGFRTVLEAHNISDLTSKEYQYLEDKIKHAL